MIGTLGLRYELPVADGRFRPYLAGGLGINNSEQEFDFERLVASDELDDSIRTPATPSAQARARASG